MTCIASYILKRQWVIIATILALALPTFSALYRFHQMDDQRRMQQHQQQLQRQQQALVSVKLPDCCSIAIQKKPSTKLILSKKRQLANGMDVGCQCSLVALLNHFSHICHNKHTGAKTKPCKIVARTQIEVIRELV